MMNKPNGWYALRIAARLKRRGATKEAKAAIREMLQDEDVQGAVLEQLAQQNAIGDGDLLDWFLENWELILKIIMTIIGLFEAQESV